MKRILILLLAVVAMILPSASKTIEFMGIPVEGTITEFTKKLQAKGFVISPENSAMPEGMRLFNGEIAGVPCSLLINYGIKSKKVFQVMSMTYYAELDDNSQKEIKKLADFFDTSYEKVGILQDSSIEGVNLSFEYLIYEDDKGVAVAGFELEESEDEETGYDLTMYALNYALFEKLPKDELAAPLRAKLGIVDPTDIEILSEDQVKNEVMDEGMAEDYRAIGVINADDDRYRPIHEQVVVTEPEPELRRYVPEKIFVEVEQPAEFPGGQAAMMKWISEHIRYPEAAKASGISGRVVVKFVVEKDGSITNPTVVKGVDKDLDKEAIRVIKSMPKWKPGKNNGEPVRSYFNLPVTFRLPD